MKTKIFAVLVTGLAVLFLGAAPQTGKKPHKAAENSGAFFCNYGSYGMMNGTVADSSYYGMMNGWHGHGYGMMNGAAPDSSYYGRTNGSGHGMMSGSYGHRYGMMGGRGYGMMGNGRYGYCMMNYGMMPMMMSMMWMRGPMMYGASDSSFVCPYSNYHVQPQRQKERK